ncbi:MAG: sugar phosphate isomerase/epimerase [Clostridia bacterium]|nr:sugar phosphate isomerase/epimerase [Clostridia bacterium]
MWDLSVSFINSSLKFFSGLDEAFKTLKEIGFDAVCPSESIPNGNKEEYISNLNSASKKHGLKINMLHLPMVCEVPTEVFLSKEYFDDVIYHINLAEKIGCKYAVAHPHMPWKREFFAPEQKFDYSVIQKRCEEINFEFFSKLQPYAINAGLEIAIENIYTTDSEFKEQLTSGCSNTDEWIKYIDTLGKGFCACLDTGHANLTDRDDAKLNQKVEDLGSRLKTLHVNQNHGKFSPYGDFHQEPFSGDIDLISFAKTLKKTGYKGDFNYEVELSCAGKEVFIEQLKYLKIATDVIYKSI